jgi:hypothetical protein
MSEEGSSGPAFPRGFGPGCRRIRVLRRLARVSMIGAFGNLRVGNQTHHSETWWGREKTEAYPA